MGVPVSANNLASNYSSLAQIDQAKASVGSSSYILGSTVVVATNINREGVVCGIKLV